MKNFLFLVISCVVCCLLLLAIAGQEARRSVQVRDGSYGTDLLDDGKHPSRIGTGTGRIIIEYK